MSVVPANSGGLALPEGEMTGLEDVEASDMVMPRLSIDHKQAVFRDNLTNQEFPEIRAVLLGLVKQRILWDDDVNEGDQPLCKSHNHAEGNPDVNRFPWGAAKFDQSVFVPNADGKILLPCQSCNLKEWGTDPKGKAPWCAEQHTYPLLMEVEDGGWSPALITFQRTGIKPSKTYLSAFVRTSTPLYTVGTTLRLDAQKRGSVEYATPRFIRGEATDQAEWPYYAQQYRSIREFITQPPKRRDDDDDNGTNSGPTPQPTPAAAAQTVAVGEDEEVPF